MVLERRQVLETLYRHVPDKSKVLCRKRITRVDMFEDGVLVHCKDGSSYQGDIIVGADGVRSVVREEMWRIANIVSPGSFGWHQKTREDLPWPKRSALILEVLSSEYRCVWVTSDPVPGTVRGVLCNTYGKDTSYTTMIGKENQAYCFILNKLDKVYRGAEIPRFKAEDAETLVQKHLDVQLTDQVTLKDFWNKRRFYAVVPIEEGLFDQWTWGRFACVGDSMHKVRGVSQSKLGISYFL